MGAFWLFSLSINENIFRTLVEHGYQYQQIACRAVPCRRRCHRSTCGNICVWHFHKSWFVSISQRHYTLTHAGVCSFRFDSFRFLFSARSVVRIEYSQARLASLLYWIRFLCCTTVWLHLWRMHIIIRKSETVVHSVEEWCLWFWMFGKHIACFSVFPTVFSWLRFRNCPWCRLWIGFFFSLKTFVLSFDQKWKSFLIHIINVFATCDSDTQSPFCKCSIFVLIFHHYFGFSFSVSVCFCVDLINLHKSQMMQYKFDAVFVAWFFFKLEEICGSHGIPSVEKKAIYYTIVE